MKENEVCDDFLGFVQIEKMDALTITDKIISSVTSWDLIWIIWSDKAMMEEQR